MVERIITTIKNPEVTYRGLSTDVKPTGANNNATFHELNTGKVWVFSELNINPATTNGWWEV